MKNIISILMLFVFITNCDSQSSGNLTEMEASNASLANFDATQTSQWRGVNRDGKYKDSGLLKKWNDAGPELAWKYLGLGDGHAAVAVTNNFVYAAGTDAQTQDGFIIAFDHSGNIIWKKIYAKEWLDSYEGVRSAPLIDGDKLFILSAKGILVAMDSKTGNKLWSVDLIQDFGARNTKWGMTENLVADGNKLFCTVGGEDANIVAFDKNTGKVIWKSAGKGEISAYNSPLIVEYGGQKVLITMTQTFIIGLDVESGKILWDFSHPNKYSVHANTPLFKDGMLYCVSGYGKGGVMLKLATDAKSVTEVWRNDSLDNKMGGVVLHNGIIYGSGDFNKKWYALDWNTGKQLFASKMLKIGNIIFADGMLYCYDEAGVVALVEPLADKYNLISSFKVPYGEKQHWAHSVIHNKRLYIRHGTALMVYDIAKK